MGVEFSVLEMSVFTRIPLSMPVKSLQPCDTEIQQDRISGPGCCFPITCTCLGINLGLRSVRAPCTEEEPSSRGSGLFEHPARTVLSGGAALTGKAAVRTKGPGKPGAEEAPAARAPCRAVPGRVGSDPKPRGRCFPVRAGPRSRGRSLGRGGGGAADFL